MRRPRLLRNYGTSVRLISDRAVRRNCCGRCSRSGGRGQAGDLRHGVLRERRASPVLAGGDSRIHIIQDRSTRPRKSRSQRPGLGSGHRGRGASRSTRSAAWLTRCRKRMRLLKRQLPTRRSQSKTTHVVILLEWKPCRDRHCQHNDWASNWFPQNDSLFAPVPIMEACKRQRRNQPQATMIGIGTPTGQSTRLRPMI